MAQAGFERSTTPAGVGDGRHGCYNPIFFTNPPGTAFLFTMKAVIL